MFSSRLKTSNITANKLDDIHKTLRLSSKAAVARIAIGLSLNLKSDPRLDYSEQINDNSGFEFQRSTLLGEYEDVYRVLIIEHLQKYIFEDQYYPNLVKAHIERGIYLLHSEMKMAGNRDKLVKHLLNV
jgi:DNA sulfur modification protein DndE